MQVVINGKEEDIASHTTVMQLLLTKNVEVRMVVVEVNSRIIQREEYDSVLLKEGDKVEFLYFMGGGNAC